ATAELINFLYDVPDGYYYDASGGGATISSTDPLHTFTVAEEEPFEFPGMPQQLRWANQTSGGNILAGNDYIGTGETLTVSFDVYRVPSDFSCDTDPYSDPRCRRRSTARLPGVMPIAAGTTSPTGSPSTTRPSPPNTPGWI
ncbi:MAG: hypothetical protein P9M08_07395, partial [Candidatus Erginobacter occultus]|nr:hypothetical protein [Candidatus Erginobacter occultus]